MAYWKSTQTRGLPSSHKTASDVLQWEFIDFFTILVARQCYERKRAISVIV